jgi:formylglycine-generating enzyme required for sulfatase activity
MVLIPPGEFLMGSTDEQVEEARKLAAVRNPKMDLKDHLESSRPQHHVVISRPFLLGATEVTMGQFREFFVATKYPAPAWSSLQALDRAAGDLDLSDVKAFCAWLSKKEGANYRLPTEAEWEYACRAGTTTKYFFGDDDSQCGKYAWAVPSSVPALAGTLLPNSWGLYDMQGNLSEWLQDGWDPNWYRDSPTVDPVCPVSSEVVYRIGCFQPTTLWLQSLSAYRAHGSPRYRDALRGFRVVRELDSKPLMIAGTVTPAERGVFVLLAAPGATERKFDTLVEAVERSSDGDTIEIRGNGPFVTPSIEIGNQSLTMRAGSGFRPVLKLNHYLRSSGGKAHLILEGLDIQRASPLPAQTGGSLLESLIRAAVLDAANCRFQLSIWGDATCVLATNFRLLNCELIHSRRNVISRSNSGATPRAAIENCILISGEDAFRPLSISGNLNLRRNTIVSSTSIIRFVAPTSGWLRDANHVPFRVNSEANVFDVKYAFSLSLPQEANLQKEDESVPGGFTRHMLEWHDRLNIYHEGAARVFKTAPSGPRNLLEWRAFWNSSEVDAREGAIRFVESDVRAKLESAPDIISPADFRLREDSAGYRARPDGKDLGADIDLVGPGEAYERWKKTPAYQQWLSETGR